MSKNKSHYVFAWKDEDIRVLPSRKRTEDEVWKFAEVRLGPAGASEEEAKQFVRKYGEVVLDDE